jgi:hypothetical protein
MKVTGQAGTVALLGPRFLEVDASVICTEWSRDVPVA